MIVAWSDGQSMSHPENDLCVWPSLTIVTLSSRRVIEGIPLGRKCLLCFYQILSIRVLSCMRTCSNQVYEQSVRSYVSNVFDCNGLQQKCTMHAFSHHQSSYLLFLLSGNVPLLHTSRYMT